MTMGRVEDVNISPLQLYVTFFHPWTRYWDKNWITAARSPLSKVTFYGSMSVLTGNQDVVTSKLRPGESINNANDHQNLCFFACLYSASHFDVVKIDVQQFAGVLPHNIIPVSTIPSVEKLCEYCDYCHSYQVLPINVR